MTSFADMLNGLLRISSLKWSRATRVNAKHIKLTTLHKNHCQLRSLLAPIHTIIIQNHATTTITGKLHVQNFFLQNFREELSLNFSKTFERLCLRAAEFKTAVVIVPVERGAWT